MAFPEITAALKITTALLVLVLSNACSPHPGSYAPAAEDLKLPARFDGSSASVPEMATSLSRLFPSPELRSLMARAIHNNPDLAISGARLREAGFNASRAQAGFYPNLSGTMGNDRSQSNSAGRGFETGTFITEQYNFGLDTRWEIDVWGRLRAGLSAADADRAAAAADYAAAHQSIAAQTAQAYFELITATRLQDLSQRSLESFQQTQERVNRRFEKGLATLGDLNLAKSDLASTRTRLIERRDLRNQAARRLTALLGTYPDQSFRASEFPSLRRSLPAGLPSSLLRLRPDIEAAYQRIRAADSRVTVAHRDLFPTFALTGSAGRRSSKLKDLKSAQFDVWSIGTSLTAPLFQAGSLRAALGAANARAEAAFSTYRSTVLTALQEVENALGSQEALSAREAAATQALAAARTAEDRLQSSYESGLTPLLDLLTLRRRSINTEEALISIQGARYQNRVTLALALGRAH